MKTFIQTLISGNRLLIEAYEPVKYYLQSRAEIVRKKEIERRKEENLPPMTTTESFKFFERVEANMVADYLKAVGNYCNEETDKFIVLDYGQTAGIMEIRAEVIRNGETFYFHTELILAGGYNIQCLHYRYIAKTNLPKAKTNTVDGKIKRVNKIEKAVENLKTALDYKTRYEIEVAEAEFIGGDRLKRAKHYLKDAEKTVERARKKLEALK